MDNRDKIKQGLKDAAACARGECDCPETTYTVRNRPGRVPETMTHKKLIGERHLFSCNHKSCGATFEGKGTYQNAWAAARKEGWRCLKVGTVWMHWCSWVHIPNDRELRDGA